MKGLIIPYNMFFFFFSRGNLILHKSVDFQNASTDLHELLWLLLSYNHFETNIFSEKNGHEIWHLDASPEHLPFFFWHQSGLICSDFCPPNGLSLSQITCLLKNRVCLNFFFNLIKFNRLIKFNLILKIIYFLDVPTYLGLGNPKTCGWP